MTTTLCKLCAKNALDTDVARGRMVCDDCAGITGLAPLPPSRRPPLPCQRCQHTELVRVVPRELTATGGDYVRSHAAPMMLTYAVQATERMIFSGNEVEPPDVKKGWGILETYVCRSCGFVEWYCQAPDEIPIGPKYNSELVKVDDPTYRR